MAQGWNGVQTYQRTRQELKVILNCKNYSLEASWDIPGERLKNNQFSRNKSPEKRLKELKTFSLTFSKHHTSSNMQKTDTENRLTCSPFFCWVELVVTGKKYSLMPDVAHWGGNRKQKSLPEIPTPSGQQQIICACLAFYSHTIFLWHYIKLEFLEEACGERYFNTF